MTKLSNLKEAVEQISLCGPKEIVLTSNKGILVYADNNFYEAPFKSKIIKGRTGRGDTAIAAYLGRRLKYNPEDSCIFAAALVSRKMEYPGPFKEEIKTLS